MGLLEDVEAQVRENARIEAERSLARFEDDLRRKAYPWDFVGSERVLSESYREGFIKAKEDAASERLKQGLIDLAEGNANYEISIRAAGLEDWNRRRWDMQRAINESFRGRSSNSQNSMGGYRPVRHYQRPISDPIPPGDE